MKKKIGSLVAGAVLCCLLAGCTMNVHTDIQAPGIGTPEEKAAPAENAERVPADQTEYLQNLIDRGGEVVIPDGEYVITKTLKVAGNTKIRCSYGAKIKLGAGANCPMLLNEYGAENISVEGGVWDGNNVGQDRAKYEKPYDYGQVLCFTDVKNLSVKAVTIKDPSGFGMQLTDVSDFTIEDVYFDYNKATLNEDGIHVNGYARNGYIHNLHGETGDDMVALNADEGEFYSPDNDIENIVIDGIYGGNDGWTAIRLLSRTGKVRHIEIANVFGAYRNNVVSFTHWADVPGDYGYFDDVTIRNVHASCALKAGQGHGGLIWFQDNVKHVGTVRIDGFYRLESEDYRNTANLVEIGSFVNIEDLVMDNVRQSVPDGKDILKTGDGICVGKMTLNGEEIGE